MGKMNNRVFGVLGVASIMSNWNADMSGNPKSVADGTFYGSDKALKYAIKQDWLNSGEDVLYVKQFGMFDRTEGKGKDKKEVQLFQPYSLDERFVELTGRDLSKKDAKGVTGDLLRFLDVLNFGATFAVSNNNVSVTGVVQVGQGLNLHDDTNITTIDINAPFRNSSDGSVNDLQTTLGKKIIVDEAHYFYPFSVNPANLHNFENDSEGFDGYTQEAYDKFKESALVGATALNTNSKSGSFNHFGLFIELVDGSKKILPHLDRLITIEKQEGSKNTDGRIVVDVTKISDLVVSLGEEVLSAEVFIDPTVVELVGSEAFKVLNIYTKTEI